MTAGSGGSGWALPEELRELRDELLRHMESGGNRLLEEKVFSALALAVLRAQCRWNPVYGAFVRGRGIDPLGVEDWRSFPGVPTGAFKRLELLTGPPSPEEVVFRTSGTTRGAAGRGRHRVSDPALYRASLLPAFRRHLLPDGLRPRLLSLLPAPADAPDSSLGFMMGSVADELCAPGTGWFVDGAGRPDVPGFEAALEGAERDGMPVLLAGTAFAWVHWLDAAAARGFRIRMPEGSRILETGGFKGRSRAVSRRDLYGALERALGIPASRIVNEYGMTELLSQFYEPVLEEGESADPEERRHVGPPWVRTRLLDPVTLEEVGAGEVGILCHLDLANLFSVAMVLTEDLGLRVGDGFRVLGRAPGAEPRGCSLAMEELLQGPGA